MKNLYNWIIIIIFAFVLGWCVITQSRYNTLEQEYNELLIEKATTIDSLKYDNNKKIESIEQLEFKIDDLNHTIDSLYNIKTKVQKSKNSFTMSSNISEGAELLKRNLYEKNINYSF